MKEENTYVLDLVEEGKIKRLFRARNKIAFKGAVCHITQRASGKEPLFLEEADYLFALHLLKKKSKEFGFDLFSFALMSNHIHLLLRLNEENLSKAMKSLFENYAMYFNRKYERKGHLFCGAYRCALCLDDAYLLAASLYIHLNPVKAGIVNDFSDYKWSSVVLYCSNSSIESFINTDFVLHILGDDMAYARRQYKGLMRQAKEKEMDDIWENPKALEKFKEIVVGMLDKVCSREGKEGKRIACLLQGRELENKIEDLKKKGRLRSPEDISARNFVVEQLLSRGFSITDIASKLNITRSSLYRSLAQGKDRLNATKQVLPVLSR